MRTAHARALAAALLVLVSSGRSSAQSTEAAATALFDEARKLMSAHRYAEACPKFAESQHLAPSGGTLINLGECYEHTGQTASAWAAWKDAAARANAAGKADVEKRALARAAVLEPALAKLVITVAAESDVPGLEVKRDGITVGHAEFGEPIPVDPGTHVIDAVAPKHKAVSTRVEVAPKQLEARVNITLAVDVTASPPAAPAPPTPPATRAPAAVTPAPAVERPASERGNVQRTLGIVSLGVGVAGVAVGSWFGLDAISKNNKALEPSSCRTSTLCSQNGLTLTSEAKDSATISTVAFAIGAAAIAGGATLWLTAPAAGPSAGLRVVPSVARSYGGASLEGTW